MAVLLLLQSAILGYGLFQGLAAAGLLSRHLNAAENVIVQTTAGELHLLSCNNACWVHVSHRQALYKRTMHLL